MNSEDLKTLEQLENGPVTSRVIELKSVYKNGKTTVQPVPDGMGWYKGIPRLSEADKRELAYWADPSSKFVLKHGVKFDLSKEDQLATWNWVKFSSAIARDEAMTQSTPGAEFYIHEDAVEFEKSISTRELRIKAGNLVMKDTIANHALRALLLGVDMTGSTPGAIKDFLLETAERSPETVINCYESKDLSSKLLLYKALKNNIIKRDTTGLYRYGNVTLGVTESSVVHWLGSSENKNTVSLLEREVNPEYFEKVDTKDKADAEDTSTGSDNDIDKDVDDTPIKLSAAEKARQAKASK